MYTLPSDQNRHWPDYLQQKHPSSVDGWVSIFLHVWSAASLTCQFPAGPIPWADIREGVCLGDGTLPWVHLTIDCAKGQLQQGGGRGSMNGEHWVSCWKLAQEFNCRTMALEGAVRSRTYGAPGSGGGVHSSTPVHDLARVRNVHRAMLKLGLISFIRVLWWHHLTNAQALSDSSWGGRLCWFFPCSIDSLVADGFSDSLCLTVLLVSADSGNWWQRARRDGALTDFLSIAPPTVWLPALSVGVGEVGQQLGTPPVCSALIMVGKRRISTQN